MATVTIPWGHRTMTFDRDRLVTAYLLRLAGWSYDALSTARKQDSALDAAVIAARDHGRRPGEAGSRPRNVSRRDRG